jgi:hypothetical protein
MNKTVYREEVLPNEKKVNEVDDQQHQLIKKLR